MSVEKLIRLVILGSDPYSVLEDAVTGHLVPVTNYIPYVSRPVGSVPSINAVRSYFDSYGDLRFCTVDDVQIIPENDPRILDLVRISELLPSDHEILGLLTNYEGSLDEIYQRVTSSFSLAR